MKQKPLRQADFDEFIACYKPGRTHARRQTWSKTNPNGRWRSYDYKSLLERDKLSLDIFWLKDDSLTDASALPPPEVLAAEIADELQAAQERFQGIAARLKQRTPGRARRANG